MDIKTIIIAIILSVSISIGGMYLLLDVGQGSQGEKGELGEIGLQGPQGPQGSQGIAGVDGGVTIIKEIPNGKWITLCKDGIDITLNSFWCKSKVQVWTQEGFVDIEE